MNWLCLISIIVGASLPFATRAEETITGSRGVAKRSAVVNFTELATRRKLAPAHQAATKPVARPRPMRIPFSRTTKSPVSLLSVAPQPTVATASSPLPASSFLALLDNGAVVPPDTMGAVGPNHIMTTLNSEVRIQDKTGGEISTVDLNSFWADVGNPDVFDPRVAYEPIGGRWIFSAVANGQATNAAVLVGVSATSEPTGTWYLASVDVDDAGSFWADFDNLGFNQKWICVSANIFPNFSSSLDSARFYVFDKAALYTNGTPTYTLLTLPISNLAFSVAPAQTFDETVDTLYMIEDWDGSAGQLRISKITGPVGGESITTDAFVTTSARWESFNVPDNLASQLGSPHGIDVGDTRILSCSYRSQSLWLAQNALLPAGNPTRCAAQWWQINPANGTIRQFGRIDDPTGQTSYAFPSLAVNASNDVLVGYSRFSPAQYASANYAFRYGTDVASTLRADTVLKAGEAPYYSPAAGLNRWGDFSSTVVDPTDDMTLWTIQEYAAAGGDVWSTWWGRIDAAPPPIALTRPAAGVSFPPGATITLVASQTNTNLTFTNVEFYADSTKIGETNAAPFSISWLPSTNGPVTLYAVATDSGATQYLSLPIQITLGDLKSPLGTWETKLTGFAKGTAVLEFADDFTLAGHGLARGTYGLFNITGTWGFDSKHQTVGTYTEQLNGSNIYSGNLLAKISKAAKLSAQITPTGAVKRLQLKGIPVADVFDLTGNWTGATKVARATLDTTAAFTNSIDEYLNVFDVSLIISNNMSTGSAMLTTRGDLYVATTNGTPATLSGKFRAPGLIKLNGTDVQTNKLNLTIIRP